MPEASSSGRCCSEASRNASGTQVLQRHIRSLSKSPACAFQQHTPSTAFWQQQCRHLQQATCQACSQPTPCTKPAISTCAVWPASPRPALGRVTQCFSRQRRNWRFGLPKDAEMDFWSGKAVLKEVKKFWLEKPPAESIKVHAALGKSRYTTCVRCGFLTPGRLQSQATMPLRPDKLGCERQKTGRIVDGAELSCLYSCHAGPRRAAIRA